MGTSLLEYCITVLSKVSFDDELFHKEYSKACQQLTDYEVEQLKEWMTKNDMKIQTLQDDML